MGEAVGTVTAEDQRAVFRGYMAQSRGMLWGLLIALLLGLGASLIALMDGGGSDRSGFVVVFAAVALVGIAVGVVAGVRGVRRQLPLGSQIGLEITEQGLVLVTPSGTDLIRWHRLSNLKRVGGGVFFNCAPSNVQLGMPGRLVSEEAFAAFAQRLDQPVVDVAPAPMPVLGSEGSEKIFTIITTVSDQRILIRRIRRRLVRFIVVCAGIALAGSLGIAAVAVAALPGILITVFAVIAGIPLWLILSVVRGVRKNVESSLPVGEEQRLIVRDDVLELTGTLGATILPWNRLADLKRDGDVVVMTNRTTKVVLVFSGRLVDDVAFAAIDERIRISAGVDDR